MLMLSLREETTIMGSTYLTQYTNKEKGKVKVGRKGKVMTEDRDEGREQTPPCCNSSRYKNPGMHKELDQLSGEKKSSDHHQEAMEENE